MRRDAERELLILHHEQGTVHDEALAGPQFPSLSNETKRKKKLFLEVCLTLNDDLGRDKGQNTV